jgi:hypothetical protein
MILNRSNKLLIGLFFTLSIFSTNAFAAIATTDFGIKITTSNTGTSDNNSWQLTTTDDDFTVDANKMEHLILRFTGDAVTVGASFNGYTVTMVDDIFKIDFGSVQTNEEIAFNGLGNIKFDGAGDGAKLTDVTQYGSATTWDSNDDMFKNATTITTFSATDDSNMVIAGSANSMFHGATSFNDDISAWNTDGMASIISMFEEATAFNNGGAALSWNTQNINILWKTFKNASSFNADITTWKTNKVTQAKETFYGASAFNQNINTSGDVWDMSKVTGVDNMFRDAVLFNGNISGWRLEKVTSIAAMFYGASAFNQNIGGWMPGSALASGTVSLQSFMQNNSNVGSFNQDISGWFPSAQTAKVSTLYGAFRGQKDFDQNLGSWDTSEVTSLVYAFYNADMGSADLSSWDVSKVSGANNAFRDTNFDSNLSSWDLSKVSNFTNMFHTNTSFKNGGATQTFKVSSTAINMASLFASNNTWAKNTDIDNAWKNLDFSNWDTSNVTDMSNMFNNSFNGYKNILDWNTSSVQNMSGMFKGGWDRLDDVDISQWDYSSVTNMTDFLTPSTGRNSFSIENYDKLLKKLNADGQSSVTLSTTLQYYTSAGQTDRTSLTGKSWTISGDTLYNVMTQTTAGGTQNVDEQTDSAVFDGSYALVEGAGKDNDTDDDATNDSDEVKKVRIKVTNIEDNASEKIWFDGGYISLEHNLTENNTSTSSTPYTVTNTDGNATVEFVFASDKSREDTATLVKAAKYIYDNGNPTAGTPRVVSIQIVDSNTAPSAWNTLTTVTVVNVNDTPVVTVPSAQTVNEDVNLSIVGISIADEDAKDSNTSEVTISTAEADAILTLAQTTGLTFTVGDGTQDQTMTFTGTLADINSSLATLTYKFTGNDPDGTDTITISYDDKGNTGTGGDKTHSQDINITVTNVNDEPTISASSTNNIFNTAGAAKNVFKDTNISAIEAINTVDTINEIVFTVSSVTDGADEKFI